ncbi:MAG: hypothetical protein NVSMB23_07970 [Myxococcales bacterium]
MFLMRVMGAAWPAAVAVGAWACGGDVGSSSAALVPDRPRIHVMVSVGGTGHGTVRANLPGFGFECRSASCPLELAAGERVRLSADPDPGSRFAGWSGSCSGSAVCDVASESDLNVEAAFSPAATAGGRP